MVKETVAYCGLFCDACGVYIATKADDQADLERIAQRMGTTKEEIRCNGCRSDVLSPHCRGCGFRECAQGKKIDNCEQCGENPGNDFIRRNCTLFSS